MADEKVQIAINAQDNASGVIEKVSASLGGGLVTAAKAATAAIAVVGAAVGVAAVQSFKAFVEAEQQATLATVTLQNTFNNLSKKEVLNLKKELGTSTVAFDSVTAAMEKSSKAAIKLGFDDEDTALAFGKLFQITKSVIKSQEELALAQDLAAAKGISLAEATNALAMVHAGGARILKQFGIQLDDNATSAQALAVLQEKVGGTAEAMSNTVGVKLRSLGIAWGNLKENIGEALAKAVSPFIDKLTSWANDPRTEAFIERLTQKFVNFITKLVEFGAALKSLIDGAIQRFLDIWGAVKEYLDTKVIPTLRAMWDVAANFLGPAFSTLWDVIKNQLWPALQELWKTLEPFTPMLGDLAKILGAALYGAILLVVQILTSLVTIATQTLTIMIKIATFVINTLIGAWNGLKSILDAVVNAFVAVADAATRAGNAVSSVLPKMNQGASLNPFSGSFQLPHFAAGGIVTKPTIGLIGEAGPEAIIPLSKMQGAGGVNVVINYPSVRSQQDISDLAKAVGDELVRVLGLNLKY